MVNLSIIRDLCKENRITIKELAEKIDMSFSGLYSSITNDTLKVSTLDKIATVLEVGPAIFFTKNPSLTPPFPSDVEIMNEHLVIRSTGGYKLLSEVPIEELPEMIRSLKIISKHKKTPQITSSTAIELEELKYSPFTNN